MAKRFIIVLFLAFLSWASFFLTFKHYKESTVRTIDEVVYYRMAEQVAQSGLPGYTTRPYGEELHSKGRPLPPYFFEPLFKHPPVYTFLLVLVKKLGGHFAYLNAILNALMIVMVYWLSRRVFSQRTAVLAAVFYFLDPIAISCSQKIWMDTSIAFFTLAAVLFFVMARQTDKLIFYVLAGASVGLAANTKYTGILILGAFFLFALFYERELFRQKRFWLVFVLPFVLFFPWILWNLNVYKTEMLSSFFVQNKGEFSFVSEIFTPVTAALLFVMGIIAWIVVKIVKGRNKVVVPVESVSILEEEVGIGFPFAWGSTLIVLVALGVIFKNNILHGFQFGFVPRHSWATGAFAGESSLFYFEQLVEFSLIYVVGIIALLSFAMREERFRPLVRMSVFVIFVFFIIYGNYQSRYILSIVPFFIILACDYLDKLFKCIVMMDNFLLKSLSRFALYFFVAYVILHTVYLNMTFTFFNDMCYF